MKNMIAKGVAPLLAALILTACAGVSPSCSSPCRANSTIRIAFFAASAISTTRPIWVRTLLSIPLRLTPIIAARMHIGTIRMIASGMTRLSYCAASTRKTSSTARAKTSTAVLPAYFC